MAKYKPVRPKNKSSPAPRAGLPCVILLFAGLILVGFFLYFVMRYASG